MPEKAEPPGMLVLPAVLTLGQATACRAMLLQTLRAQNWPEVVVDAAAAAAPAAAPAKKGKK